MASATNTASAINATAATNAVATADGERPSHPLNEQELAFKEQIHQRLLGMIDLALINTLSEPEARSQIRQICRQLIEDMSVPLSMLVRKRIVNEIEAEVMGLGPLEPLLADSSVADIL